MPNLTSIDLDLDNNSSNGFEFDQSMYQPTLKNHYRTTSNLDLDRSSVDINSNNLIGQMLFESPVPKKLTPVNVYSKPLQIWEGTVISVDDKERVMHVSLDSKLGQISTHTAEIELEWVAEQDKDLVSPGSVFYLTLFKQTKRTGVQNSQELRFRRRPSWSKSQITDIERNASELLSKMKGLPLAK